jgi:hypothetical protein
MRQSSKVSHTPLVSLWDDNGYFGERLRRLTSAGIQDLLREGPCRFVEVNVGWPLEWISLSECFDFWKQSCQHIADNDRIILENFPDGFAYVASQWIGRGGECVIVLEKFH